MTLLGRPEREVWLMPLGALLDQWEVYRQYQGIASVKTELSIENVVPSFL